MIMMKIYAIVGALLVALLFVTRVDAAPYWNEGFEYADNAGWFASGNWINNSCPGVEGIGIMEISSDRAFTGTKSLKLTYIGLNPIKTCFIDRFHTRTPELYTRRHVYLQGFSGTNPPSKMMFTGENAYVNFWSVFEGSSNLHRYNLQGSTLPVAQQNPVLGNIPSGRWVCIETHTKMNTPGVADGILEEWVDGSLRVSNKALLINAASQSSQHNFVRLYRQHGNGVIYLDELAVGTTRIGCATISSDTTPPLTPSNFVIN
jgi:hypothetical protein